MSLIIILTNVSECREISDYIYRVQVNDRAHEAAGIETSDVDWLFRKLAASESTRQQAEQDSAILRRSICESKRGRRMKLKRSSTSAAKLYWDRVDRTAQKADAWPDWKKTDWVASDRRVEPKDQPAKRTAIGTAAQTALRRPKPR